MEDYERKGLISQVYLALCAYVEAHLSHVIRVRLRAITDMLDLDKVPTIKCTINEALVEIDRVPLLETLRELISHQVTEMSSAQLVPLLKAYERTFHQSCEAAFGKDCKEAIDALAQIRNVIAHGRVLSISTGSNGVNLDKNPIHPALKYLQRKKAVKAIAASDENLREPLELLFTDSAVLCFLEIIRCWDNQLRLANAVGHEEMYPFNLYIPSFET